MASITRPRLKTAFEKSRVIGPLHTGGPLAVTPDGLQIVTCVGEEVVLTRVEDGVQICRFAGDTETTHSLCLTPSSSHLMVFTASLSLYIYEMPTSTEPLLKAVRPIRSIPRAHEAPVHVCKADPTSTYLASGSADGVVKVFDIIRGFVTHAFKGHGGVVSALAFNYPRDASSVTVSSNKMQLITASVDTRLRIFDLSSIASRSGGGRPVAVLEGHVSVPRGIDVTSDGKWLISGGRDSVVLIWDLTEKPPASKGGKSKGKEKGQFLPTLVKTIPILDRIEAVGLLHPDEVIGDPPLAPNALRFYTGGAKGVIQVWDGREGSLLFTLGQEEADHSEDHEQQREIVDAIYIPSTSTILSVHADQNILFHSLHSQTLSRQLIGFNDEIIDATFLSPSGIDSHLAIASNSSLIRVYSLSANDARLLSGHTGIVLCLDHGAGGRLLASGGKDKSARIWAYGVDSGTWNCVAICEGHAESIGAVAMSQYPAKTDGAAHPKFMFTGSQDRTLKMWDLSSVPLSDDSLTEEPLRCKSLTTHKAHEKDINSLDIAPNDRLLASGSQDRTAKVYEIDYVVTASGAVRGEIKLLGTCKGHKRGVWTVKFGRTERVLATGSGDKSIKLWSLDDFTCVKTFEGHTNSVLRVDFLNKGMQMVSCASDGLLKLWNVRDEECVASMDNHEDKIWALAISNDESTVVTGAADSVITFWQDCTEEKQRDAEHKRADLVMKEQDFTNYLALNDYRSAILLALTMDQPGRLLSLFKNVRASAALPDSDNMQSHEKSITGHPAVDMVLKTLPAHELAKLLRHLRHWNTTASTSVVAQTVLHALLKLRTAEDIANAYRSGDSASGGDIPAKDGSGLSAVTQALIPYTERHLARMDRLIQESYVVDYILGEMDDGMFGDEYGMDLDDELIA